MPASRLALPKHPVGHSVLSKRPKRRPTLERVLLYHARLYPLSQGSCSEACWQVGVHVPDRPWVANCVKGHTTMPYFEGGGAVPCEAAHSARVAAPKPVGRLVFMSQTGPERYGKVGRNTELLSVSGQGDRCRITGRPLLNLHQMITVIICHRKTCCPAACARSGRHCVVLSTCYLHLPRMQACLSFKQSMYSSLHALRIAFSCHISSLLAMPGNAA